MDIFNDFLLSRRSSGTIKLCGREGHKDTSCPLKRYESALQITPGCKGNFGLLGTVEFYLQNRLVNIGLEGNDVGLWS